MVCNKKPSTIRASIGRSFSSKIGTTPFQNVKKCLDKGKQVLSRNNALVYEIFRKIIHIELFTKSICQQCQVLFLFHLGGNNKKIFSSLFHSRDKPRNSTAGSAYRFTWAVLPQEKRHRTLGNADDGGLFLRSYTF